MKVFAISAALALLTSVVSAAPAVEARSPLAHVTFIGAADAADSQDVPTDGSFFYVYSSLSASKIRGDAGATCYFYGIDGSFTVTYGGETKDVGPPQRQYGGYCYHY
ncbi:MAG: hypothetical protein Q9201_001534 [Fulgogasparrea decipioides]